MPIKNPLLTILLSLSFLNAFSQAPSQSLRGTVKDKITQHPISDVSLVISNYNTIISTDSNGFFKFPKLPIGQYHLSIDKVGYQHIEMDGIELYSGKELVLTIELEEKAQFLKEVVVTTGKNRNTANNPFSLVSTRKFGPQEAIRYAGGFQDPSRMALAFAGVTNSGNDDNNEIIIRGNSPRGLLWRLEGIEIPNPNHFADGQGSTSGIVSMINAYSLANSDFMTGAFPANYGNASSGVFDLNFRKGNNKTTEYAAQISLIGLDFGMEGPLNKNGAAYRIAGRYSTLELLLKAKIIELNTGNNDPKFKDLNFNFDLPTKKMGEFTFWGLTGNDQNAEKTSTEKNIDKGSLSVFGLSNKLPVYKGNLKTILSFSFQSQENGSQIMNNGIPGLVTQQFIYNYPSFRFSTTFTRKINSTLHFETGFILSKLQYNLTDNRINAKNILVNYLNENGQSTYTQSFLQFIKKWSPQIKSTFGLHQYRFLLNQSSAVEPRFAIQYENKLGGVLSAGLGIHSRLEPVSVYLFKRYASNGSFTQPNMHLAPGTAFHYVVSYEQKLNKETKFKVEAYIQNLTKVPIDTALNGTYTLLNSSGGIPTNILVNEGRGQNKGIELTLEKFYAKSFYYLITASLFDSKYEHRNNVWRNTIYNNQYAGNVLIGKEIKLTRTKSIACNFRYTLRGGNRYTPILLAESIKKNATVLDNTKVYQGQYPDYWRTDVSLSYKINKNKSTWSFGGDIQNATNRSNIISQYYELSSKSIKNNYALPRIPIIFARVEF